MTSLERFVLIFCFLVALAQILSLAGYEIPRSGTPREAVAPRRGFR